MTSDILMHRRVVLPHFDSSYSFSSLISRTGGSGFSIFCVAISNPFSVTLHTLFTGNELEITKTIDYSFSTTSLFATNCCAEQLAEF